MDTWVWAVITGAGVLWVLYKMVPLPSDAPIVLPTPAPIGSGDPLQDFAAAIAFAEGYGADPTNLPTRHNNPGDLSGQNGILTYPTPDDGWAALRRQLDLIATRQSIVYTPDFTIRQIASYWTATEQDAWAGNVAYYLQTHGYPGVSVDTAFNAIVV